MAHLYEVGKLYNSKRRSWPEGIYYDYREGGHDLILFWSAPSAAEIEAVTSGSVEFGLLIEPPAIFVISEFRLRGRVISTADSPYNWWLNQGEDRTMPNPEPTEVERILLPITLVDAATGIIKALRAVSLSPEFSHLLNQAIRDQSGQPFCGPDLYKKALDTFYTRYATPELMLEKAVIRCKGGD